mgnify:FL=1
MNPFLRYQELLAGVFEARASGDEVLEDRLLDRMDEVWEEMDEQDRARTNDVSRRIASGELAESEFIQQIKGGQLPQLFHTVVVNPVAQVPQRSRFRILGRRKELSGVKTRVVYVSPTTIKLTVLDDLYEQYSHPFRPRKRFTPSHKVEDSATEPAQEMQI